MKVDVIIPIYNALEYLESCVTSLYRFTDESKFSLYLINDCSPDLHVSEYLNNIKSKHNNIHVDENEFNLGFVGTVNKGMKNSANDVILLNSDTEVTPNWIEKMVKAAYSDEQVATVTTLTNSGTICSIPNFCEDNEIPAVFDDYLALANIIDRYSISKYPQAPTGVGFCMYIKRTVLDEVGFFDEKHFGKGYGEENDFCCRCREHGYTNIIDDTTFVYHKGSMSFSDAKNEYIKTNLETLSNLYPYYNRDVALFCERNPLKEIQDSIKLKIALSKNKENILYVLHNDFIEGRNHPYGGTEMHVKDLVDNLKQKHNCFVLSTCGSNIFLDVFYGESITTLHFPLDRSIELNDFHRSDYKEVFSSIIKYFNIGLIHVHHFKGNTFDIIDVSKEEGLPVFYTMHDFHSICPNINLLYDDSIHCKYLKSENTCNKCIKKKHLLNNFINVWQKQYYQCLEKIDKIITPSQSAKDYFIKYYRDANYIIDEEHITVISHGEFEEANILKPKKISTSDKLKIVIFGGIIKHKGSRFILDLLKNDNSMEWFIYGNIYESEIMDLQKSNVHIRGVYDKKDILEILNDLQPDITLNLPIWPETFSYVLTESFAAGIPVLGTNLGALSERIKSGENGWHLSFPLDLEEIMSKLETLNRNRDEIQTVKNKLEKYQLKYVSDMVKEYELIYSEFYMHKDLLTSIDENRMIVNGFTPIHVMQEKTQNDEYLRLKKEEQSYLAKEVEYLNLLAHVEEIHKSTTWNLLQWINKHLLGIKQFIRRIIQIFKK